VTIYPSEFGKERLQKESQQGPAIFEQSTTRHKTPAKETEEGVDTTLLRKYQLERLRYYYAIVECSSVGIANQLYKSLDGTELGATANILDLRFVPDNVTFDGAPKDEASSVPEQHEPVEFVTDALQHSKPKLTWDGEDPQRKRLISEAFTHDTENGKWEALLGSSDDEEEEEEEVRQRYRQLLLGGDEPENHVEAIEAEMEEPSDAEQAEDDEADVRHKEETTLESYKRKERERKHRRREEKLAARAESSDKPDDLGFDDPFFSTATPSSLKRKEKETKRLAKLADEQQRAQKADELELLMHDEASGSNNHFNINHILKYQKEVKHKKKKKRDAEKEIELQEGFHMDVNDPRFANVYRGGEFAIDPNSSAFRKGLPGMEAVLQESRRRKRDVDGSASEGRKKRHK
jgi:hypothetical protein